MSYLMYNSQRLIPAPPAVSIQKVYSKTPDGTPIGAGFSITLNGTFLPDKGSPMVNGTFWDQPGYPPDETVGDSSRLKAVLRKQEALRNMFSTEGGLFEIQSADGSAPMKCNPRVISIAFEPGIWYTRCDYVITLECDVVYVNGGTLSEDEFTEYIQDASESWSFETDETPEGIDLPRTYRISHTVSATGKRFFDETGALVKPAWAQAEQYVLSRLGYSALIAMSSGVNGLPSDYNGYNHSRSNNQDILGGQYSVTESWILAKGAALEEFTVSIKNEANTGVTGVSIAGSINGLEERNPDMSLLRKKYTNALTKWTTVEAALLTRAQTYAGVTLNPFPLSKLISKNDIAGNITYSYDYDTRPTNLFTGAVYESITISENLPADLFASIPVIGRQQGPVLQDLSSKSERSVTLNLEVVIPPSSFGGTVGDLRTALYSNPRITQPDVFDNVYQAARPGLYYSTNKEFIRDKNENWDPKNGRYNFSCNFVFGN